MMFFVNLLARLISILHSGEEPRHLAGGFALGSIIGLTPLMSLHNLIIACLVLLLNVSISSALFAMVIFGAIGHFLDPLFHRLGYYLLVEVPALQPVWTHLYNVPIAPLTKFYNTVVLGSLVASLVLFWPTYAGFKSVVKLYRRHVAARVDQWRIMKLIKANTIVGWYNKVKSLGV